MAGERAAPLLLIGAGNMGGALLLGWLKTGLWPAGSLVLDPKPSPAARARAGPAVRWAAAPDEAAGLGARVAVLAVKPDTARAALTAAAPALATGALVISIAAGTRLTKLACPARPDLRLMRAMPNTPAQIAAGIAACFPGPGCTEEDRQITERLMGAVGAVAWVEDERDLDAVTAVSGSGPAYVFLFAEALGAAGAAAGLKPELAARLARHTVSGAGALLTAREEPPEALRTAVTSKGGTTDAALRVLMAGGGLTDLLREAVAAATRRAGELADES